MKCKKKFHRTEVCLVSRIMRCHTDEENYFISREVLQEQLRQGWKGLAQEVVEICQQLDYLMPAYSMCTEKM